MIELTEGLEWAITVNGKYIGNAKTAADWQSTINAAIAAKTITQADLAYPNVVKYLPVDIGEQPVVEVKVVPAKKVAVKVAKPKKTVKKKKAKE